MRKAKFVIPKKYSWYDSSNELLWRCANTSAEQKLNWLEEVNEFARIGQGAREKKGGRVKKRY